MDAVAAMERISELENRIRQLTEDRTNYFVMVLNYQAFVDTIPDSLPGKKKKMTRLEWVDWAKKQLGYDHR